MSVFIVISIIIVAIIDIATKEANITILIRSVQLQFKQEFFGIVYADYDRNSACKVAQNFIT